MGCSLISPEPRRRVGALKGTICASQLQQRQSISRASVTCGATRSACRDRHGLKARGGGGAWAVRPTLAPEPAARSFARKVRREALAILAEAPECRIRALLDVAALYSRTAGIHQGRVVRNRDVSGLARCLPIGVAQHRLDRVYAFPRRQWRQPLLV